MSESTSASLSQDIAIVTGASRGIGRAIANELARQGATVIGTATSDAGAQGISAWLHAAGYKGRGAVLNVADADSIDAFLKDVENKEGPATILVNNAGITRDNLLLRMKAEEWDDILNTNLTSVFRLSKGVLRGMMKARRGRIINIASVVGVMGNAGQTNYAASKAGVIGMVRALAPRLAERGTTVNAVAPGFIETEMTGKIPFATREFARRFNSLQQGGKPVDVAETIAYLADPASQAVTGQVIRVCGQSQIGA